MNRPSSQAPTLMLSEHRYNASYVVAERVGFEPTDHFDMINALAGRPIRPLWHLSNRPTMLAAAWLATRTKSASSAAIRHPTRQRHANGSRSRPSWPPCSVIGRSSPSQYSGMRLCHSSKATRICKRARCAPWQRCGPAPKAKWRFGVRSRITDSESGKTRGSRFAE